MGVNNQGVPHSLRRGWRSVFSFSLFVLKGFRRGKGKIADVRGRGAANPFFRVAIVAVAVSVAAVLLALSVASGFSEAISERVLGFVGDVQVVSRNANSSYEQQPIPREQPVLDSLCQAAGLRYFAYGVKPGIIKGEGKMQGCVLKGVDAEYDFHFLRKFLLKGRLPAVESEKELDEVLISQRMAGLFDLDTGEHLVVYFLSSTPRVRRLRIVGLYNTFFDEFDQTYIFADLRHIQVLEEWGDSVGGYEVKVGRVEDIVRVADTLRNHLLYRIQEDGSLLRVIDAKEKNAALFDWLALQEMNAWVIMVLMVAVACANLVTALLLLVLERRRMIALLMALGATGRQIKSLFIFQTLVLLGKGLLVGNALALSLCGSQLLWGWARLDPSEYFLDRVPIALSWEGLLGVNALVIVVAFLILLLPASHAIKVEPAEVFRYT